MVGRQPHRLGSLGIIGPPVQRHDSRSIHVEDTRPSLSLVVLWVGCCSECQEIAQVNQRMVPLLL